MARLKKTGPFPGSPWGHGERFGNMAGDFGDFNHDGRLDLLTSRYSRQPLSLYRNEGLAFRDVASAVKLAQPTIPPVKWGVGFGDFDNDGWPDVVVANGNFSCAMDKLENEIKFREPIQFFRNLQGRPLKKLPIQSVSIPGLCNPVEAPRLGTLIMTETSIW